MPIRQALAFDCYYHCPCKRPLHLSESGLGQMPRLQVHQNSESRMLRVKTAATAAAGRRRRGRRSNEWLPDHGREQLPAPSAASPTGGRSGWLGSKRRHQSQSLPTACPKKVTLVLAEGVKTFDTREALDIIAQNMSEMLATKGPSRIAQTIPLTFDGKDPYTSCPFYMAGFFVGFEMGATISGVIPLDTIHSAANRPSWQWGRTRLPTPCPARRSQGSPWTACRRSRSIWATSWASSPAEPTRDFLAAVDMRNREAFPPRASDHKLTCLRAAGATSSPSRRSRAPSTRGCSRAPRRSSAPTPCRP